MSHTRREIRLLLAISAIALLGLGCKSPQQRLEERIRLVKERAAQVAKQTDPIVTTEAEPAQNISQEDDAPNPSSEIIYLRQVMNNLKRAETFRAKVDVPVQGGTADISVDYNKSIGLYGRLRIDIDKELTISDIFISETEMFFRANTNTWTNITDTDQAKVFRVLFQRITLPNSGEENFVSEYAQMQERTQKDNCDLYAFKQYNQTKASVELYQICIKGDLPVYVITESPFGEQRIEYKDINNFVDVQHPAY